MTFKAFVNASANLNLMIEGLHMLHLNRVNRHYLTHFSWTDACSIPKGALAIEILGLAR